MYWDGIWLQVVQVFIVLLASFAYKRKGGFCSLKHKK